MTNILHIPYDFVYWGWLWFGVLLVIGAYAIFMAFWNTQGKDERHRDNVVFHTCMGVVTAVMLGFFATLGFQFELLEQAQRDAISAFLHCDILIPGEAPVDYTCVNRGGYTQLSQIADQQFVKLR